ncbi:MAG: PIN domain-containing protein [archaeon]
MDKKTLPDTSIIIIGKISELIESGKLNGEVIILESVISELENQANKGRTIGFDGLEELAKLKELEKKGKITLNYHGERPSVEEIKAARFGSIDGMIREAATKLGATLLTGDYIMYLAAKARGIECKHIETKLKDAPGIEQFFDKETMSVHLKAGLSPMAKKGMPGKVEFAAIREEPMKDEELDGLYRGIMDKARATRTTEISANGATVVQDGNYRIVITEPPFTNVMEITAAHPIKKPTLDSYLMSDKLRERLDGKAEGIFICGSPGAGKSSFAAALAEHYQEKGTIVKTLESPRDLQVGKEITQYGPLEGSMAKSADILLLVRPDYTIYDELRKSSDFTVFADMRLAGVGMVGVTHSSEPVNAIQRLVGRLELGQIAHIVDTVIFIKDAKIQTVYETKMKVKVPAGMMEADLARPVVEVLDFESGRLEYEIYTFGEETVVMPAGDAPKGSKAVVQQTKSDYIITLDNECANKEVTLYAGKNFLLKTKIGRITEIRLNRRTKLGKIVERALRYNDDIKVFI